MFDEKQYHIFLNDTLHRKLHYHEQCLKKHYKHIEYTH